MGMRSPRTLLAAYWALAYTESGPFLAQVNVPAASTELPTALGLDHRLYMQPRIHGDAHAREPLGIVAPSREQYIKPSKILDTIETCEVSTGISPWQSLCITSACARMGMDRPFLNDHVQIDIAICLPGNQEPSLRMQVRDEWTLKPLP